MLQRSLLPSKSDILSFGARHNAEVWHKHREHLRELGVSSPSVTRALDAAAVHSGRKLSRQHVFEVAGQDTAAGVVASIVWGFPKGGLQGGRWKPFASAFAAADRFARVIEEIRARGNINATVALEMLNAVQPGVGFATTSKIAYFAKLPFAEGTALIFDKNVIEAIQLSNDDGFERTRRALGPSKHFYGRGTSSYSAFVADANIRARDWQVDPDQIETALFLIKANARSGWH